MCNQQHSEAAVVPAYRSPRRVRLKLVSCPVLQQTIRAVLCEGGADVNAQGGPHGSALQAAALEGKEEVVKMLLEKGADVNPQGGLYGSALQAAGYEGNDRVTGVLLEHGADVNAQYQSLRRASDASFWKVGYGRGECRFKDVLCKLFSLLCSSRSLVAGVIIIAGVFLLSIA
jgi:ankyrin repeat protein